MGYSWTCAKTVAVTFTFIEVNWIVELVFLAFFALSLFVDKCLYQIDKDWQCCVLIMVSTDCSVVLIRSVVAFLFKVFEIEFIHRNRRFELLLFCQENVK